MFAWATQSKSRRTPSKPSLDLTSRKGSWRPRRLALVASAGAARTCTNVQDRVSSLRAQAGWLRVEARMAVMQIRPSRTPFPARRCRHTAHQGTLGHRQSVRTRTCLLHQRGAHPGMQWALHHLLHLDLRLQPHRGCPTAQPYLLHQGARRTRTSLPRPPAQRLSLLHPVRMCAMEAWLRIKPRRMIDSDEGCHLS